MRRIMRFVRIACEEAMVFGGVGARNAARKGPEFIEKYMKEDVCR